MDKKPKFIEILSSENPTVQRLGMETLSPDLHERVTKHAIRLTVDIQEGELKTDELGPVIIRLLKGIKKKNRPGKMNPEDVYSYMNEDFFDWILDILSQVPNKNKNENDLLKNSPLYHLFDQSMRLLEVMDDIINEQDEVEKKLADAQSNKKFSVSKIEAAENKRNSIAFERYLKESLQNVKTLVPEEGFSHWPKHIQDLYRSKVLDEEARLLTEGLSLDDPFAKNSKILGARLHNLIKTYHQKRQEVGIESAITMGEVQNLYEMLLLSCEIPDIGAHLYLITTSKVLSSESEEISTDLYLIKVFADTIQSFL